jgi:hypothetical protein
MSNIPDALETPSIHQGREFELRKYELMSLIALRETRNPSTTTAPKYATMMPISMTSIFKGLS